MTVTPVSVAALKLELTLPLAMLMNEPKTHQKLKWPSAEQKEWPELPGRSSSILFCAGEDEGLGCNEFFASFWILCLCVVLWIISFLHLIVKWLWGTRHERCHLQIHLAEKKNYNKQLRQIFQPSAAAMHPSLLAELSSSPLGLFGLLQNELVAFSIPTCCVSPLITPWGHGACSRRVKFAANCIILSKSHLSEIRLQQKALPIAYGYFGRLTSV